uniref:C3H1-type domain-containing protein n=1 Tax=Meloidogyne incognita TaxID=6306 RepID=A0A914L2B8_MELIC
MIIQDENRLKTWISHIVEDISDAEPDALAKYVIALVKKPLAENVLEELCLEKLSVFLQSHTEPFVNQLFATLRSEKYLNQKEDVVTAAGAKEEYVKEQVEQIKQDEDAITAETDELVLTDPDSPEQVPVEKKKEDHQKKTQTRASGMVTSSKSTRDEHRVDKGKTDKSSPHSGSKSSRSVKESTSTTRSKGTSGSSTTGTSTTTHAVHTSTITTTATTTKTSSTQQQQTASQPTGRPFRKRISPPRSNSAERRGGGGAERRVSPVTRRRVVIGRETGNSSSGAPSMRVTTRHYRETRRARSKSRERSRSPVHVSRKEKRLVADFDLRSLRRHRCRDFHEKGFCMRGDGCPYDHGPDPVVADATALEKIVRASGSVFDTSSSFGVNPPPPGLESSGSSGKPLSGGGSISEGYNPEAPALTTPAMSSIDFSVPPPPILPHQIRTATSLSASQHLIYPPGTIPPPQQQLQTEIMNAAVASLLPSSFGGGTTSTGGFVHFRSSQISGGQDASATVTSLTASTLPTQTTAIYGSQTSGGVGQNNPGFGTTNSGGGMTMRGGRFKPYSFPANRNQTSRSLLVKKIPQDLNKIAQLDQHFSRFGQITNIQVQYEGRPDTALVTFKTRRDAMAAYKSVEPILNNRFIKIFWQNDKNASTTDDGNAGMTENTNPNTTSTGGPTIPLSKRPVLRPLGTYKKTFIKPQTVSTTIEESAHAVDHAEGLEGNESLAKTSQSTTTNSPAIVTSSVSTTSITSQAKSRAGTFAKLGKRKSMDRDVLSRLKELQRMKTGLYAKLVEQQKTLLEKLKGTEDKEQRKRLIALVKKSESTSQGTKTELEQLANKILIVEQRQTGKQLRMTSNLVLTNENTIGHDGSKLATEAAPIGNSPPKTPNKKLFKLCRVVYALNCPQEQAEKLIVYMEKFGDLFDYDINTEPMVFTYKDPMSAQKAVSYATTSPFPNANITIEWAPVSKSVSNGQPIIPDGERKPSEQVTPKDLLASLDYDEDEEHKEEEEDDDEHRSDGEIELEEDFDVKQEMGDSLDE